MSRVCACVLVRWLRLRAEKDARAESWSGEQGQTRPPHQLRVAEPCVVYSAR